MSWIDYTKIDKKEKSIMKKIFAFITSTKRTNAEKYEFLKDIKIACELQLDNFKEERLKD